MRVVMKRHFLKTKKLKKEKNNRFCGIKQSFFGFQAQFEVIKYFKNSKFDLEIEFLTLVKIFPLSG